MRWSRFTPAELERRRKATIEELRKRDLEAFLESYQELCDTKYWKNGPCCAGCDHWQSNSSLTGQCSAAGIVSGEDVLRSMGIWFCTYLPAPDFPYTESDDHCGKFKDDFDWSTLPQDYRRKIGCTI